MLVEVVSVALLLDGGDRGVVVVVVVDVARIFMILFDGSTFVLLFGVVVDVVC